MTAPTHTYVVEMHFDTTEADFDVLMDAVADLVMERDNSSIASQLVIERINEQEKS